MKMQNYLDEIKYAVESTLSVIWSDAEKLEILQDKLEHLTRETERGYQYAEAFQYDEDPDDVMLGVGIHWDTYFGSDKKRYQAETDVDDVNEEIRVREFSRSAMSGNILQYAKQGISIAHGELKHCPNGRSIGSQVIKTVIWQGRNQSLHWEEKSPRQPIIDCFDQLSKDIDNRFSQYTSSNLAFDVVKLLNWKAYDSFEKDMQSLA